MASNIVNNALSQYDNVVTETASGSAGFGSLKDAFTSVSSLKNKGLSMVDNLQSSMMSFADSKLQKLNELAEQAASKFNINGILDQINSYAGGYFKNLTGLLGDLASDAINQLKNSAVTFVSNIAEDFINQVTSAMYIPDEVFAQTIKGLYFKGADLAYNNHYLRKKALKQDWATTLRFLDEEYGIKYNYNYYDLHTDLSICASNCCWKNMQHIFNEMYDEINNCTTEISRLNILKRNLENKYENYYNTDDWKDVNSSINDFQNVIDDQTNTMRTYFKRLIVESIDYLNVSAVRKFFDKYPKVLKPSMFSEGEKYQFTIEDCIRMLPKFGGTHEVTESDKNYLMNSNNDDKELYEKANTLDPNSTSPYEEFRATTIDNQIKNGKTLNNTAIIRGSTGVYKESFNRYAVKGQNSPKNAVKYRSKNIGTFLDDTFNDDKFYVNPRNNNIKKIYIMLASPVIFGRDAMVNEAFYKRCKFETMTGLKASYDKMKGIIGAGYAVQSLFELSDRIDSAAYDYTKKVEKYLFDPASSTEITQLAEQISSFYYDPSVGRMVRTTDMDKDIYGTTNLPPEGSISSEDLTDLDTNHGSNPISIQDIEDKLDKNIEAKIKTINILRFVNNIPMVLKRDILIKWLTYFYKFLELENEPSKEFIFKNLVKYIFGKENITTPDLLDHVFDYSTNESLNDNCKSFVAIYNLGETRTVLQILDNANRDEITNLFNTTVRLFGKEIQTTGFAKSLLLYDKEYLSSYLKTLFYNEMKYLKSINSKNHELYSTFYEYKDDITEHITGFDRKGIFGYNDSKNRVQYTNIETGDWLSCAVTSKGTFFGGSDNTPNNGIKIINEAKEEIINTNITSGNWTDIFEYFGSVFFIKDNNEIYYWNGKSVVKTNLENFSKFDVITITSNNAIIFAYKSDNLGFYYWNGSKFIRGATTGSDWTYTKVKSGYVLYPTNNAGNIYLLHNNGRFINTRISDVGTSASYVITSSQITSMTTDPSTGQQTQTTTTIYNLYILIGTKSNGCHEIKDTSNTNSYDFNNVITQKNSNYSSGFCAVSRINDTTTLFVTLSSAKNITYTSNYSYSSLTWIGISSGSLTIQNESNAITDIENPYKTFEEYKLFKTNELYLIDSEHKIYYYNLNTKIYKPTEIDYDSFKLKTYFVFDNNIYAKLEQKGLYRLTDSDIFSYTENEDSELDGWKLINAKDIIFVINENYSKGIKYIQNNELVNTNITTGYWNISYSDDYIYVLSKKNTNKGVKITNTDIINFVDFSNNPITDGDISFGVYDKTKQKIYFGSYRGDLILDIDGINYDIDEFIFTNNYNTVEKCIKFLNSNKLDTLDNAINKALDKDISTKFIETKDESPIIGKKYYIKKPYRILTSDEYSKGVIDGVIYYNKTEDNTYYPIDDIDTFDPGINYYVLMDGSGDYWELICNDTLSNFEENVTYYETISSQISLNDVISALNAELDNMDDFDINVQKNSNIYNELMSYAEAKNEFDIDDDKVLDSMLLDFIYNYDYSQYNIKYKDAIRDMVVSYNGRFKKICIPLPEHNPDNDHTSDDYMNSDPDPNNSIFNGGNHA